MNKKAERILKTTIRLFLNEGVNKVTMDQIAENAKASKVTVYKYFLDKDTLYYETTKYIFRSKEEQLQDIIITSESLVSKLQKFLDVVSEFSDSGLFSLCKELSEYSMEINHEYDTYLKVYKDTMLMLIDKGIEEKQIKQGLDRMLIFIYIDMGVEYYQNNSAYRYKINHDKKFQEAYLSFFIGNVFKNL
jgi:AcrR family transcriptional regulator